MSLIFQYYSSSIQTAPVFTFLKGLLTFNTTLVLFKLKYESAPGVNQRIFQYYSSSIQTENLLK